MDYSPQTISPVYPPPSDIPLWTFPPGINPPGYYIVLSLNANLVRYENDDYNVIRCKVA